jgi:hypothetical protein
VNNLVHKHSVAINKPKVYVDRKQKSKQGYTKHKTAKQGGFILFVALLILLNSTIYLAS